MLCNLYTYSQQDIYLKGSVFSPDSSNETHEGGWGGKGVAKELC